MDARIIVGVHRSELQALKARSKLAKPLLLENHGTLGCQLDRNRNQPNQGAEDEKQRGAPHHIDHTLHNLRDAILHISLGEIRIEPGISNRFVSILTRILRELMNSDNQARHGFVT